MRTDYLVLVTKTKPIPEHWEEEIHLVEFATKEGTGRLEEQTYAAFRNLQADLREEHVLLDAASTYRSTADQKQLWGELLEEEGEAWVKAQCAVPGYSEHHTGLALDAELDFAPEIQDQKDQFEDRWLLKKLHSHLAEHGFILRYPKGKEAITGYQSEWWHIRYVGHPHSEIIMNKGLALEEYLGGEYETNTGNYGRTV